MPGLVGSTKKSAISYYMTECAILLKGPGIGRLAVIQNEVCDLACILYNCSSICRSCVTWRQHHAVFRCFSH